MSTEKGLLAFVYRDGLQDCTANGQSSRTDRGVLTGIGIAEIFEPSDDAPEYVFVKDSVCGGKIRLRAIPRDLYEEGVWTMFGGNFLYTSDGRFPSDSPIKIHDRVER